MSALDPADILAEDPAATASSVQHARLRRELRRFDTIFFLLSAMVVVDTIGAVAIGGAQAFTWLLVLFATFFVPSALASAELGAAMPEEGGLYVWVREAFGRFWGALASLLYWAGTPFWLGGSVTAVAIAVWGRVIGDLSLGASLVFGTVFVGGATLASVLPLRLGKWVPTSGAIGQILLLLVFTASVALYGLRHGVHGLDVGGLAPSTSVLIAIVPVLLYSFVGIELPSTAGEEMVDPRRDIPAAIARAGVGQLLMYGIPVLAVLVVLPPEQITSLHGLIDAMRTVFTVYGGSVAPDGTVVLDGAGAALGTACALLFIWVLAASGTAWIMGAGRAQAAACLDGAGPAVLGRISERTGVPVVMGLISGGVSWLAMAVNLWATRGDAQRYFSVALTVSIALIVLAYLLVFPAFLALRLRRPGLERPFRAPGGLLGAAVIAAAATLWAALASACLLWPGLGTAQPDASLPDGFAGDRATFELLVLGPIGVLVVVAAILHRLGRRSAAAAG